MPFGEDILEVLLYSRVGCALAIEKIAANRESNMEEYGVKTMEDMQNLVKIVTATKMQPVLYVEQESDLEHSNMLLY